MARQNYKHMRYYWLFWWILVAAPLIAQVRCGTHQQVQAAAQQFPELLQQRAATLGQIQQQLRAGQGRFGTILRIPVVVHVLYSNAAENVSNQRILEQIQVLNEDFRRQNRDTNQTPADFLPVAADAQIEFCLAIQDPNNQPTSGITRRAVTVPNIGKTNTYYQATNGTPAWDTDRYLNIWVCAIGGGTLGFAYPPGAAPAGADGVVIDPKYFGITGVAPPYNAGRTTTHEVGHYLNLQHVWGPGTGGCGQDDGISDTPLQDRGSSGCLTHPNASCNSSDMFMNFMDYSNDACMNLFTVGQSTMMRSVLQGPRINLINNTMTCAQASNDAGARVLSPIVAVCTDSVRAQIELVNYGNNTLQSLTLYYQLNQQPLRNLVWTGALNVGQRTTIALPALPIDGNLPTQRLRAWTSMPNGTTDSANNNDTAQSDFQATIAVSAPFTEGFESGNLPAGWQVTNPDNAITWAPTTQAASAGAACFYLNNWNYGNIPTGQQDWLETPPIQLPSQSYVLQFDLAYALYSATGYSDTLRITASADCGQTWTPIYEKYDDALTTVANRRNTEFFPNQPIEWRQETVSLSQFVGASTIKIRFEHLSEAENNLFIDQVLVTPATHVQRLAVIPLMVTLSPNPATNQAQLQLTLDNAATFTIQVYNVLGQAILEHTDQGVGRVLYQLDTQAWATGCYTVKIQSGVRQWTGRLLVQ